MAVASWWRRTTVRTISAKTAPQMIPSWSTKSGVPVTTATGMPAAAAARARTNAGCTAAAPASPMTIHA